MRICSCLAALAVLVPCAAGAQTTTADGVQALIRGDYAAAARILRPLAEDSPQPDPLAQFFMATLYQSGRGVTMNWTRACGLYLRAARTPNPFMTQSLVISNAIREVDPREIAYRCNAASEETWHDPPAALFTLGPDHWVRIDSTGVVAGYRGSETKMEMGGPGWVFLPTRHIPLDVPAPAGARRHFIQFTWWTPSRTSGQPAWMLTTWLCEVVESDIEWVAGAENFLTIAGARPPTSVAIDSLARVQVNADGEAEWVVSGEKPSSRIIPYRGRR